MLIKGLAGVLVCGIVLVRRHQREELCSCKHLLVGSLLLKLILQSHYQEGFPVKPLLHCVMNIVQLSCFFVLLLFNKEGNLSHNIHETLFSKSV